MKRFFFAIALTFGTLLTCSANDGSKVRGDVPFLQKVRPWTAPLAVAPRHASANAVPLQAPASPAPRRHARFSSADGACDVYGYVLYDLRIRNYAWVHMNSANPNDYSAVKIYGQVQWESPVYSPSTMVGDRVFTCRNELYYSGYWVPSSLGWLDYETGEYTKAIDYQNAMTVLNDMTYDPVSKKVYIVAYDLNTMKTDLLMIDPENPELAPTEPWASIPRVAVIDRLVFSIAADHGVLYGIAESLDRKSTTLLKIPVSSINAAEGSCDTQVVSEGMLGICVDPSSTHNGQVYYQGPYWQSAEFDKTNHRLYWNAQLATGNSAWCEVNTVTGTLRSNTPITANAELVGLSIPYQTAAEDAPSYVRNLKVTAASEGQDRATVTWNNPQLTYMNEELQQLSGVRIYRDEQLLATVETTETGKAMTWEDTNVPSGIHTYKLLTYNDAGDGIYKDVDVFVGRDVPGQVTAPQLNVDGNQATISWQAPQTGANGGWYDASSLTYDVVRHPDGKVIVRGSRRTSTTDVVTEYAGYSYEITAINNEGVGSSTLTNRVAFGPACTIPFVSAMNTQDDFQRWITIDNNYDNHMGDGMTWHYDPFSQCAIYEGYGNPAAADDYLVSPALSFEEGKSYQVRYRYYTSNWVDAQQNDILEKMQVYYGQNPTADGLTTLVKDLGEFHTASANYLYGKDNFTPAAGTGYLAFKAVSDADRGIIYLSDISVREYSSRDLSVTHLRVSPTANVTIRQTAVVEVTNEGSAPVADYTVQIIDAMSGEVLSETTGGEIAAGDSKDISVDWIPEVEGKLLLTARVVLNGDTYPADNEWQQPVEIEVASADGDLWLTVTEEPDNTSWNVPFKLNVRYSQCQIIRTESEMQKKNILLTGIRLMYNGNAALNYPFPVSIAVKATDRTNLMNEFDEELGSFEQGGFTQLYSGHITLDADGPNTLLTIRFDTPYEYKGGNLNFRFIREYDGSYLTDDSLNPEWRVKGYTPGQPEYMRCVYYRSNNSSTPVEDEIYALGLMPYIRFAYKDLGAQGIEDNTMVNGCDNARTYDLMGRMVDDKLTMQKGFYIVGGKKVVK